MRKVKNYPGTNCASDHVAVVLDYCMKLKKILQPQKERKFNLDMLTQYNEIQNGFKIETKNCLESVEDIVEDDNISINEDWNEFKDVVADVANKLVGKNRPRRKI